MVLYADKNEQMKTDLIVLKNDYQKRIDAIDLIMSGCSTNSAMPVTPLTPPITVVKTFSRARMSSAAKAKISLAAKARWAKARRAGRNHF